jgi:hypothetical protein
MADQVDWILAERRRRNTVFVSQLGDIVEHFDDQAEWARADEMLSRLIGVVARHLAEASLWLPKRQQPYRPPSREERCSVLLGDPLS